MRLAAILTCCLLGHVLYAQSSTWVKAVDGSLSRTGHAVVQFNNRVWSLGGRAANAGAPSTPAGPLTNEIWSSPDASDWTLESVSAPWSAREGLAAVEFNGRLWVIGGEADVWSSADGLGWSRECGSPGWGQREWHTCVVLGGQIWLLGGREGNVEKNDVWSSSDGVTWSVVTSAAPWVARARHASVVFNGRMWVMGGTGGGASRRDVWSSPDGANWTQETGAAGWAARERHAASVHNGRIYVLGGKLSGYAPVADVWSSQDGTSWTEECHTAGWGMRSGAACLTLGNELWVIGGAGIDDVGFTDAWSSTDGCTWTSRGPRIGLAPGRIYEGKCVFNNRYWIIGGGSVGNLVFNDVWSSPDGVNWTQVTAAAQFGPRACHSVEVLNGRMYVLGGEQYLQIKGDVWSSDDGITWTLESMDSWPVLTGVPGFGGRSDHMSTVYNGRIWVMGGITNLYNYSPDVWSSADGATWTLEGSSFPQDLTSAQVREFNGAMWLFGGDIYGANVWSSTDGASWTLQTSSAAWGQRMLHASAVHGGRMWLIGGAYTGFNNDLWSTADGVNWVQEAPNAAFAPVRAYASGGVLNGSVFMHGGWDGNSQNFYRSQDSWHYIQNGTAPQFTSSPVLTVIAGQPYGYAPAFTGSPAPKLAISGAIPAWLEIDAASGAFSGTPAVADVGTSPMITLTINNAFGSDSQSFQITVLGPAPHITSAPPLSALVNQPYSYAVIAVGGPPAPTLSATGLPAWLAFNAATAELSGTPGIADIGATGNITVTATNGTLPDAVQVFAITVAGTAAAFTSTPVTEGFIDHAYSYTVTASGLPAVSFSVGALPGWLSFDAGTGTLSGTPSIGDVGERPVEIHASTGWGPQATQQFTIIVPDPLQKKGAGSSHAAGCASGHGNFGFTTLLVLLACAVVRWRLRRVR